VFAISAGFLASSQKPDSMEKLTLYFDSLTNLTAFAKRLNIGFLLNTSNLTLTGKIQPADVALAVKLYKAKVIETTEKVYSYDKVG
jgi:hypothetical protein